MNISSIVRACLVLLILVGPGFGSVGCTKQPPQPGTCDACGSANDLSAKFCGGCGAALAEPCPGCSAEIRVGVRYCPDCGVDLVTIRKDEAGSSAAAHERDKIEVSKKIMDIVRRNSEQSDAEERLRRAMEVTRRRIDAFKAAGGLVVELGSGVDLPLVEIKPGRFMMGSPASERGRGDDETQNQVTISKPFWLGQTEVTQAQWQAVMGSNRPRFVGDDNPTRPVEGVLWREAVEFCRRLSQQTGMTFRLPTEAEWEYACRAGATTAYSFGDDASRLGEYAWFDDYSVSSLPVASKKSNAWGLYDMHGNVWEWCEDSNGGYPSDAVTAPHGLVADARWVLRGGSIGTDSDRCRAASRVPFSRMTIGDSFYAGFRVAMSALRAEEAQPAAEEKVETDVEVRFDPEAWVGVSLFVEFEVTNASTITPPALPTLDGASVRLLPGERSSSFTQIVNGRMTRRESRVYTIEIRPTREGDIEIPPIEVVADGKRYRSEPTAITVRRPATSDLLLAQVRADPSQVYLGESMSLVLRILVRPYQSSEFDLTLSESDMWSCVDLNSSSWGIFKDALEEMSRQDRRPVGREIDVDDRTYYVYDIPATLRARRPGVPELGDISILLKYPTGIRKERDFFGRRNLVLGGTRMLVATPESDGLESLPLP